MKVAYVLPSLQNPSGWRTHALAFIQAMCAYVEPVLFVAVKELEEARQLFPGLKLYPLPVIQDASLGSWQGGLRLATDRRKILTGRYQPADLVHSLEAYPTGLVGHWLAHKFGRPHVLTAHGTYAIAAHGQPVDRIAYERVLRSAAFVGPVSQGTARQMQKYFGKALSHTWVRPILNGNDFYRQVPPGEALERDLPEVPTILSVGDVKPRKGQRLSLEAFARVKAQFPEARYFIAGSLANKAYTRQLQDLVAERGLSGVFFLGAVPGTELRQLFLQASVFVLTPQQEGLHFEGFGLVYLEAGAYGLPVVGSRTGGVPDAIHDGVTGLLVDPGDVEGTAQALLRILQDPALAREMGRANRRLAEELTWERCAAEYFQVYRSVLEPR